jgi:hypothetical protein
MGPRRTAMLLMLAASQACAQPIASSIAPETMKPILLPPPVKWDRAMLSHRPVVQQTATDFANLTGGLGFGMSPAALNARLPKPYPGLGWSTLALAPEYVDEVRYFALPLDAAGRLRMDVTACAPEHSSLVLLFSARGLFRLSYRLPADQGCGDPNEAAQQILAHYVPISPSVALSMRYRSGTTEVVDITDPAAKGLLSVRWRQVRP